MRQIIILTFGVLFSVGCATTHTRVTQDKVQLKKVLVLTPQIEAKVKYIDVPKFFHNEKVQQKVAQQVVEGYQASLKEKGYKAYTEKEIYPTTLYRKYSRKIKHSLRASGEKLIANDLEYNYATMPQNFPPKIHDPFPEEWDKYDAVVFLYGNAKIETDKEFCTRWRGNIAYNLMALPLSVTTLLFPFLVPIAFVGSGEYSFDKSPDETFLNVVVVDTFTRKVLYQHDYFISEWGFSEDEFHSIAFDSLDEFPER